jgi:hypothetical protein
VGRGRGWNWRTVTAVAKVRLKIFLSPNFILLRSPGVDSASHCSLAESILRLHKSLKIRAQCCYRLEGRNSASLCSLAGWYDNPIPTRFIVLKFRAQIFILLRSPGIDSKESILIAHLAWRAGTRVSDPHWFNADSDTDPDPAFFLIADPDPEPGFDDLKLKKIYIWKFNLYFLDQKLQFTYP